MDLRDEIERALAPGCRLDEELPGGGMARVFRGHDITLGRDIVIKVLNPDVAEAVSKDRFRNEVRIAAGMEHPLIVPVLTAGTAGEYAYFTMPFVAGESLRARLNRAGAMEVEIAVPILRDVAEALVHAHSRGVVHRDIKPGNILLSDGRARVTDFGIAKAVAGSLRDTLGGQRTLTGIGVGTAEYLAPEQAIGDRGLDHRADLYAFGVMAYEMFTGTLPFSADSAQAYVVAHLTETPRDVRALRPDLPPALGDLVMACLAKDPSARPESAAEVQRVLQFASTTELATQRGSSVDADTPAVPSARVGHRRRAVAGGVLVAGLGVAGWLLATRERALPAGADGRPPGVVVAMFESADTDSGLATALTHAARFHLGESKTIALVEPATISQTLRMMERAPTERLTAETAREVGIRLGAPIIVTGRVARAGSAFLLSVEAHTADSSRRLVSLAQTAADSGAILDRAERLLRALRRELGERASEVRATPPLPNQQTRSLAALEYFARGTEAAYIVGDHNRAIALFEAAVAEDSTFAVAWRTLAIAYNNANRRGPLTNERAAREAYRWRHRADGAMRTQIEATYFLVRGPPDSAIAAHRRLIAVSDSAYGGSNLASLIMWRGEFAEAAQVTEAELRRNGGTAVWSNWYAAQARIAMGDLHAADTLLRQLARHAPLNQMLLRGHFAVEYLRRPFEDLPRWLDSTQRAGTPSAPVDVPNIQLTLAALQGRFREAQRWNAARRRAIVTPGRLTDRVQDALVEANILLYGAGDAPAAQRLLARATAGVVLDTVPLFDVPEALLTIFFAHANDTAGIRIGARRLQRLLAADSTGEFAKSPARLAIAAALAEHEGKWPAARAALDSLPVGYFNCLHCKPWQIGRHFAERGSADSAIHWLTVYLNTPSGMRYLRDDAMLPYALERLSALHEARGDDSLSLVYTARLLNLWRQPDPEFGPRQRELLARRERLENRAPDRAR